MEILNTSMEQPNIFLIALGVIFIGAAGFLLWRTIRYLRWKANATAFFCLFGFVVLLFLGIATLRNNIGQSRIVYDVMIKDDEALQEMKKDYTIIRQSGIIYTIKPKKAVIDPLDQKVRE